MSRHHWKAREREAARLMGGKRFPANMGGRLDGESTSAVWQVKERRTLSLAALESLAVEMERLGAQSHRAGLVLVKRSAGRGVETPMLVCCTAATWRHLMGALPIDTTTPEE